MDLYTELLSGHADEQNAKISNWVGNDAKRLAEVVDFFLSGEHRASLRAGWIVNLVAEKHPKLIKPHLVELVKSITDKDAPVAVKRNIVRLFQFTEVPEKLHGDVMNACFGFLLNPKETTAVRVFSMTVLANLSKYYPDIKTELKSTIENILEIEEASAGFKNRALKILKALK
jgi:hypothetical protein